MSVHYVMTIHPVVVAKIFESGPKAFPSLREQSLVLCESHLLKLYVSHQIKSLMSRAEYIKKNIKVSMNSSQKFNCRIRHTSSDCISEFATENKLSMFDFKRRLGARLRRSLLSFG